MTDDKGDIIRIMCPNLGCQRILAVPPRAQGRIVRCRGCGTNIRIPTARVPETISRVSMETNQKDSA